MIDLNWHAMTIKNVVAKLNTDEKDGLSKKEADLRKYKFGENELSKEKNKSIWQKFLAQFSDFMVITLVIAAGISFLTSFLSKESDYIDTIIILVIVITNAIVGMLQESKAEKEIESLKVLSTPLSKVIRGGKVIRVPSKDIVPGDILFLKTGDLICADARIIESTSLAVEESAMTGESLAVEKSAQDILSEDTLLSDRKNMVFAGSVVNRGHAKAIVVATGMKTEVGKVALLVSKEKNTETPLQRKLASTGKIIAFGILIISVIVFVLGIMQNVNFLEMLMISISLAVAAIPEGLPAVVTIVLANGVRKMAKLHTVVRNLPAVETLGHASVICSDKTGTLTLNKMTVVDVRSVENKEVLGNDFSKKFFTFCTLCNNSILSKQHGETIAQGEPTENALLMAGVNCKVDKRELDITHEKVFEVPFNSKDKFMITVHKHKNEYIYVLKGAPESVIKFCKFYDINGDNAEFTSYTENKIKNSCKHMAESALRILAVAYKRSKVFSKDFSKYDFIFYGLAGLIDPPRPEVKEAVRVCKTAGIKPVIITGDHIETANAIAKKIGILEGLQKSISGEELNNLSENELAKKINDYSVFARVSPEHKVKIVKAFQKNGNVVAMTGDGVNDAPALKVADIGCAMGKTGTDAAKYASDMIITDDNFATIVEAVRHGRGMFENIRKTVHFLISTNIGEVMVVLLGFLMKIPPPLLAIHLLWINLVTDAFPALALGVDPIDKNIMKKPPLEPNKSLFSDGLGYNIVVEGLFIAAIGILSYSIGRAFFDVDPYHPIIGQTMAFLTLGLSQLMHSFNVQSRKSLVVTGILNNLSLVWSVLLCIFLEIITASVPTLTTFFKTAPLNSLQWLIVWLLSLSPLLISELEKILFNKKSI